MRISYLRTTLRSIRFCDFSDIGKEKILQFYTRPEDLLPSNARVRIISKAFVPFKTEFIRNSAETRRGIARLRINKFSAELHYTLPRKSEIQKGEIAYNCGVVSVPAARKKEDSYSFVRGTEILSSSIP